MMVLLGSAMMSAINVIFIQWDAWCVASCPLKLYEDQVLLHRCDAALAGL